MFTIADRRTLTDQFLEEATFSVEQIIGVLKQAEVGVPVGQVRQDENTLLKQLVAELSLAR